MAAPIRQERQGGFFGNIWPFGGRAPKDVVAASIGRLIPKPDLIDSKSHPLHLYPGFEDFAAEWNQYASTDRLAIQTHAAEDRFKLQQMTSPLPALRRDLAGLTAQRVHFEEAYAAVKDDMRIPRKVKYTPLKNARRAEWKKREEIEEAERLERQIRGPLEVLANTESVRLQASGEEWALSKDENRVVFFAVERFREDRERAEELFIQFIEKTAPSEQFPYFLGRLYYRFVSLIENDFTHTKTPNLIDLCYEMAERAWYRKHPEHRPTYDLPRGRHPQDRPSLDRRVGREVFPGNEFRWLVTEGSDPIVLRDIGDARRILRQMKPEQKGVLRMTKLNPADVFRWSQVSEDELQYAESVEEEGAFYGWKKVPRGKQWELLLHEEEDDRIVFYLRRLPEGMIR